MRVILRTVLFIMTPILPIVLIFKVVSLEVKIRRKVAKWRETKVGSPSKVWLEINKIQNQKMKLLSKYSDLKIIDTSIEGVPQLFILVVFSIASSIDTESGLGLQSKLYTFVFLIGSVGISFASIISSILTAINIQKEGFLQLTSKIVFGLSMAFQLLARLILMTAIAVMAALPFRKITTTPVYIEYNIKPLISPSAAAVLLLLPFIFQWTCLTIFKQCCISDFRQLSLPGRIHHILRNTWTCLPIKDFDEDNTKEEVWSLAISGVSLLLAGLTTAAVMPCREVPPGTDLILLGLSWRLEFLLVGLLPSLLSHLLASGLLFLFYKAVHPWRELWQDQDQEDHEMRVMAIQPEEVVETSRASFPRAQAGSRAL